MGIEKNVPPRNKLPFISIVIVTWNAKSDLVKLLASIKKSDYPKNKIEVIVVDNGSTDSSVEKIKKRFPETKIISLAKNIGIPARNVGLKKARGEIVFSIDSDVVLTKNTLTEVVKKFQDNPRLGLISVKAIDKQTKKPLPYPLKLNFFTGVISSLNPNKKTTSATYLAGLFHAFPRKILKKVGYYERRFFFYGDDLDFCLRIKKAGYKMLYYPKAKIFHGKSASTPEIPFSIKYHHYYKAIFRNIYKYGNTFQKISVTFVQLIAGSINSLLRGQKNTFFGRFWGLWWNLKHIKSI